jgi:putative membrane protein
MNTMRKIKYWKTAIIDGMLIIVIAFGITSCGNSTKPEDTKDTAEEHNDAKFDNNKTENDAQFLVDAAEINLMEIQLGNLAAEKGMTAEVKDMGKMMSEAHSKSLEELNGLATKKSVTVPTTLTDEGQSAYKKLNDKTGKDFDKDYCDMMVSGHKDAIDRFEKAADNSTDMDIKNWATTTLPALRKHLDQAITCQDNYKKM